MRRNQPAVSPSNWISDATAFAPTLAVIPRSEHQVQLSPRGSRRERLEQRRTAVDVLLVEQAQTIIIGTVSGSFASDLVDRLRLPPPVVAVLRERAPEAELIETARSWPAPAEPARRNVVRVVLAQPPLVIALARSFLIVGTRARRADGTRRCGTSRRPSSRRHRRERHGGLQRRMRIHRRHDGGIALVRAAERRRGRSLSGTFFTSHSIVS